MRWRPGSSGCKGCSHNGQHNGSRRLRPMHIEGGGGARERGGEEVQTVDRSSWASPPAPVCVQPCFLFRVLGCVSSGRNLSALSASAANSSSPRSYLLELEKARTQVRKNLTKAWSMCRALPGRRGSAQSDLECGPVPPHRRVREGTHLNRRIIRPPAALESRRCPALDLQPASSSS